MRRWYKAGFGLCVGVGLAAGVAALGLGHRTASAAEPSSDAWETTTTDDEETAYDEEEEEQGAPSEEQESEPYALGPLTGQPGPGWSPEVGGAPTAGSERPRCSVLMIIGPFSRRQTPQQQQQAPLNVPLGALPNEPGAAGQGAPPQNGLGAGIGGAGAQQPFNLGPLPGTGSGAWSWSPHIGGH